jgi:hypothetical protein
MARRPRRDHNMLSVCRYDATLFAHYRRDRSSGRGIEEMAVSQARRTAAELRRKAKLCRQAANVSTEGGHTADSILLTLADELEREAEELERRDSERRRHRVADD